MNKLIQQLSLASCLCLTAVSSSAVPLYYTFTGEVTSIGMTPDLVDQQNIFEGDNIAYTWLIDFDVFTNDRPGLWNDTFQAELVSDRVFSSWTADQSEFASSIAGRNWLGYESISFDNELSFIDSGHTFDFFEEGAQWTLTEMYENFNTGSSALLMAEMVLTTISDTYSISGVDVSPVPIPAALPLFAFGLAGLFGLRRKKLARNAQ